MSDRGLIRGVALGDGAQGVGEFCWAAGDDSGADRPVRAPTGQGVRQVRQGDVRMCVYPIG